MIIRGNKLFRDDLGRVKNIIKEDKIEDLDINLDNDSLLIRSLLSVDESYYFRMPAVVSNKIDFLLYVLVRLKYKIDTDSVVGYSQSLLIKKNWQLFNRVVIKALNNREYLDDKGDLFFLYIIKNIKFLDKSTLSVLMDSFFKDLNSKFWDYFFDGLCIINKYLGDIRFDEVFLKSMLDKGDFRVINLMLYENLNCDRINYTLSDDFARMVLSKYGKSLYLFNHNMAGDSEFMSKAIALNIKNACVLDADKFNHILKSNNDIFRYYDGDNGVRAVNDLMVISPSLMSVNNVEFFIGNIDLHFKDEDVFKLIDSCIKNYGDKGLDGVFDKYLNDVINHIVLDDSVYELVISDYAISSGAIIGKLKDLCESYCDKGVNLDRLNKMVYVAVAMLANKKEDDLLELNSIYGDFLKKLNKLTNGLLIPFVLSGVIKGVEVLDRDIVHAIEKNYSLMAIPSVVSAVEGIDDDMYQLFIKNAIENIYNNNLFLNSKNKYDGFSSKSRCVLFKYLYEKVGDEVLLIGKNNKVEVEILNYNGFIIENKDKALDVLSCDPGINMVEKNFSMILRVLSFNLIGNKDVEEGVLERLFSDARFLCGTNAFGLDNIVNNCLNSSRVMVFLNALNKTEKNKDIVRNGVDKLSDYVRDCSIDVKIVNDVVGVLKLIKNELKDIDAVFGLFFNAVQEKYNLGSPYEYDGYYNDDELRYFLNNSKLENSDIELCLRLNPYYLKDVLRHKNFCVDNMSDMADFLNAASENFCVEWNYDCESNFNKKIKKFSGVENEEQARLLISGFVRSDVLFVPCELFFDCLPYMDRESILMVLNKIDTTNHSLEVCRSVFLGLLDVDLLLDWDFLYEASNKIPYDCKVDNACSVDVIKNYMEQFKLKDYDSFNEHLIAIDEVNRLNKKPIGNSGRGKVSAMKRI